MTREESMAVLREGGVPYSLIGAAFGVSKQYVGATLGPMPAKTGSGAPPTGDNDVDVSRTLRDWRARHGLSQAAAARILGVSLSALAPWETGRIGCSLPELLVRFVRLYDLANTPAKKVSEST